MLNIIKGIKSIQQLQFTYWFHNPGSASFKSLGILVPLIIFTLFVLSGISLLFYNKFKVGNYPPKNRILNPVGVGLVAIGLSGLVFTLMRSQGISFLGVRFFLIVHVLVAVLWVSYYSYLYFKRLPGEAIAYEAAALKKKYLAKPLRR
jgi:hypothetical protein